MNKTQKLAGHVTYSALLSLLIVFATAVLPAVSFATERWYSAAQTERGGRLFAEHCAACHGTHAEATPNWRERDAQGNYPPPPLNGTAHAWHHPKSVLRRTIRDGGAPLGGQMPAFGELLSSEDIDAVIAWFQSKWPDDIYIMWAERNAQSGGSLQTVTAAQTAKKKDPLTKFLSVLAPDAEIGRPEATTVPGIFRVKVGPGYVYLDATGRYAFTGDLLDLKQGTNLTESRRGQDRLEKLETFPESDRTVYPAQGQQKAALVVFTDPTCPYCRRLHTEVSTLQRAGAAVHYVPFPRDGPDGEAADQMRAIWCAADRGLAMDVAKGIREGDGESGRKDCPAAAAVVAGYRLGGEVGVRGTPAIVMPDGKLISGYRPAADLLGALGLR